MKRTEYHSVWEERRSGVRRRRDLAIKKAKVLAEFLRKEYKAKEVILFGSLIWRPEFLWRGSDIDLLVKGLEDKRYFEILSAISTLAHPFHVDLIPFKNAWPAIKRRALKRGMKLE